MSPKQEYLDHHNSHLPEEGVPLYRGRGEEKGERTWTLLTTITPINGRKQQHRGRREMSPKQEYLDHHNSHLPEEGVPLYPPLI
jgi:hypothetical protein